MKFRSHKDIKWGTGGGTALEAYSLPDNEKERLCRDLLSEFGVTHIRQGSRGELVHGCLLPFGNHQNQDREPTASLNYLKLTYNPLAYETRVKTFDGERAIGEMVGTTQLLMDGDGKWVESQIISSGIQPLYRVTLVRNGRVREVYATAEHRWMIQAKGVYGRKELLETTTIGLNPKDRIPSVWTHQRAGRLTVSPFGVARGFVFGDGTMIDSGAVANFAGRKDQALLPYFGGLPVGQTDFGQRVGVGLPRSWKTDLPNLDEGPSYLYGWLAGYFAADGCVAEDGHVSMASSKRNHLDHVMAICDRIGIATWGITETIRQGYGDEESSLFTLTFRRRSLPEGFFLIEAHRERVEYANQKRQNERTHWWVRSVEPTSRVEEVFCAIVPTTHSFVLEGNILTGNCFGCASGGSLLWFVGVMRDTSGEQARKWLLDKTVLGGESGEGLASLLTFFDEIYNSKKVKSDPMPHMSVSVLDPWLNDDPYLDAYMVEMRGVPKATLDKFKIGYAEKMKMRVGADQFIESPRIVIPHFWEGSLVGWQSRRLVDDGTPKYKSTPDFPKDRTLYNYDRSAKEAVIVESPLSVLSKDHLGIHMEATFGASVPDRQHRLIAMHPKVIIFADNDEAGWKMTHRLGELESYSAVYVANNPYACDPADLDDETYKRAVAEAIPYSIWEQPKELIPCPS